ncbi:hypothetical protein C5S42_09820, partial [Candidatus Methanomarinus sp.]
EVYGEFGGHAPASGDSVNREVTRFLPVSRSCMRRIMFQSGLFR